MMIERSTGKKKMDNLLIIDGDEGYGKTTIAIQCAYYVHDKTGRKFDVNNVFFDTERMIEFAKSTTDQIIVWDEAALAGLASEWQRKLQKQLIKLVMVARKKRHFYIFNIPKFFKLNEYLIVDRAIGMIHVYAKDEKVLGRFCYYVKRKKNDLYYEWRRKKNRSYKKYASFKGTFTSKLDGLIDEEEYERKKDIAILNFNQDDGVDKNVIELRWLKGRIATIDPNKVKFKRNIADHIGISPGTFTDWARHHGNTPNPKEIRENDGISSLYDSNKSVRDGWK